MGRFRLRRGVFCVSRRLAWASSIYSPSAVDLSDCACSHEYRRFHAFPLLRSNAHILCLPFELQSLADIVINIIIISVASRYFQYKPTFSPLIINELSRRLTNIAGDARLTSSRPWARKWMSTLGFTGRTSYLLSFGGHHILYLFWKKRCNKDDICRPFP